ncbi:MAG: cysteine peptidase family C39 domain-containing protein [archaeon]
MINLAKIIKQKFHNDCGPAALATVFCYYNKCQDYPELLKKSELSKGTDNPKMKEMAEEIGFKTFTKENSSLEDIKNYLARNIPVIINYIEPELNWGHYAIITNINDKITLANPDTGKQEKMEISEFEKRWISGSGKYKRWMLAVFN